MFRLHLDLIPSMICQLYILENNRKLIKDSNGMEIRNFKHLKTHSFFFCEHQIYSLHCKSMLRSIF